jgi:predicted aspartyl protease
MPLIFKLKKHKLEDGSITYRPYVKVTLISAGKAKEVAAVLDTGSDLIYLPKQMAEYFALPLSKQKFECKTPQNHFEYSTSKISIEISKGHEKYKKEFSVTIPSEEGIYDEVILGVEFLSQFKITFDYANESLVLKKSEKKTNINNLKIR